MKEHYMIRKSKEFITLKCGSLCFNKGGDNYFEEEMTGKEQRCMLNCFQKTFRYLAYANTVQTFLTGDPAVLRSLMDDEEDPLTAGVGLDSPVEDASGKEVRIPSR